MSSSRANLSVLLAAAAVLAAALAWAWFSDRGPDAPVAGFTLTDHHGAAFGPARLTGRWSLVTFGLTSCPDVCPAALMSLAATACTLRERGEQPPRVVFVTVDPGRDTPQVLARYVGHFDERFLGVTGAPDEIAALESQLGASHRIHEPQPSGYYAADHSAALYVIDPEGRLAARLEPPFRPATLVSRFVSLREGRG